MEEIKKVNHLPSDWDMMPWRSKWVWLMENYGEFDECAEDEPYTYDTTKMPEDVREEFLKMRKLDRENREKGIFFD